MNSLITQLCNGLSTDSSFWSGIIGALVGSAKGGAIAYFIQALSLKEARNLRKDELLLARQTLATSMLLKVVRIHGNCSIINSHMKECLTRLNDGNGEQWQVFIPLAIFPALVYFTTEEQTMLFGLKDNLVFENTIDLDVAHNSLLEGTKTLSEERRILTSSLNNENFDGLVGSSTVDRETLLRLKPKMIEVNQLVDHIKNESERTETEAISAMEALTLLFKSKLNLTLKTELRNKTV
jgi:hypothetical protein